MSKPRPENVFPGEYYGMEHWVAFDQSYRTDNQLIDIIEKKQYTDYNYVYMNKFLDFINKRIKEAGNVKIHLAEYLDKHSDEKDAMYKYLAEKKIVHDELQREYDMKRLNNSLTDIKHSIKNMLSTITENSKRMIARGSIYDSELGKFNELKEQVDAAFTKFNNQINQENDILPKITNEDFKKIMEHDINIDTTDISKLNAEWNELHNLYKPYIERMTAMGRFAQ